MIWDERLEGFGSKKLSIGKGMVFMALVLWTTNNSNRLPGSCLHTRTCPARSLMLPKQIFQTDLSAISPSWIGRKSKGRTYEQRRLLGDIWKLLHSIETISGTLCTMA